MITLSDLLPKKQPRQSQAKSRRRSKKRSENYPKLWYISNQHTENPRDNMCNACFRNHLDWCENSWCNQWGFLREEEERYEKCVGVSCTGRNGENTYAWKEGLEEPFSSEEETTGTYQEQASTLA